MLLTVMQCVNVLLCIHVLVQLVAKAETFEPQVTLNIVKVPRK